MRTFLLPATEADLNTLSELFAALKRLPFEFAHADRDQKIEALEKKWIVPTREKVTGLPAISAMAEQKVQEMEVQIS